MGDATLFKKITVIITTLITITLIGCQGGIDTNDSSVIYDNDIIEAGPAPLPKINQINILISENLSTYHSPLNKEKISGANQNLIHSQKPLASSKKIQIGKLKQ